jgi:uncharacterized membrane protein
MADELPKSNKPHRPFRRAVLRGIGVILPPLLTIVFLLWIWNSVQTYVLSPIEGLAKRMLVSRVSQVYDAPPENLPVVDIRSPRSFQLDKTVFVELPTKQWIPLDVYQNVLESPGPTLPNTAEAFYERYVEITWLQPSIVLPIVFSVFIMLVYLLGKFIAARVGRIFVAYFERLIDQLPIIRAVYGTVKQVTDMAFNEQDVEFTRAVAIEYPREGLWSVGFVTGESMLVLREAAEEPVISVLIPTSPAPFTGFTVTIRKSESIELDISRDQALQFVVSCGVVIPGQKTNPNSVGERVNEAIAAATQPRRTSGVRPQIPPGSLPASTDTN